MYIVTSRSAASGGTGVRVDNDKELNVNFIYEILIKFLKCNTYHPSVHPLLLLVLDDVDGCSFSGFCAVVFNPCFKEGHTHILSYMRGNVVKTN